MSERNTAIVLAAGQGKRMHSKVQKQFLEIQGYPVLYYSLRCFQESPLIQDIILVTGEESISYCKEEIVQKYHFTKVNIITSGGAERYLSVGRALQLIADGRLKVPNEHGYVFIHDGARPFLTEKILEDTYAAAVQYQACVAAVQSKDTVKIVDENQFAVNTPVRKYVWIVQTPQVFETALIRHAYFKLMENEENETGITDDAMVVERMENCAVKLVEGSYENIKITTPEDLILAESLIKKRN